MDQVAMFFDKSSAVQTVQCSHLASWWFDFLCPVSSFPVWCGMQLLATNCLIEVSFL